VNESPSGHDPTLPATFGRYQVISALARGGMGQLYLAQDREIDRQVVVKTLDRDCNPEQKQRFLREARAAGRLTHPNVVSIFDVGEQDGTPFIVMEYIAGDTLATIIRNREPLLFGRRLDLVDQLCAGLAYAHDLGVVHRDIKPSNLMLDRTGVLRILDFGIARLGTGDQTQAATSVIGTLNYMSPEQWEGGVVDGRADMFAVGAVMYELFSFTKAFPGSTPPEVLRTIFGEGAKPLRQVCPLAPASLEKIVTRMMAKAPADRYATLHDVREAIAGVRAKVQQIQDAGGGLTDATIVTGVRPVASGGVLFPTPTQRIPILSEPGGATVERRTRSIPLGLITVIGAVGLFVGWWLLDMSRTARPPAAEPQTAAPSTRAEQPPAVSTPAPVTAPAPVAPPIASPVTPPAPPPRPIDLTVTWSEPFQILRGDRVISDSAERHSLQAIVAGTELFAHSDALRLHFRINTDKSGTVAVPPVGSLAVTLAPQFTNCVVVVDNRDLRKGSILPGAPVKIASGRHAVSLKCPDNSTQPAQQIDVPPGLDPVIVGFPRGG
jgi:serine/threonine-protein kinase